MKLVVDDYMVLDGFVDNIMTNKYSEVVFVLDDNHKIKRYLEYLEYLVLRCEAWAPKISNLKSLTPKIKDSIGVVYRHHVRRGGSFEDFDIGVGEKWKYISGYCDNCDLDPLRITPKEFFKKIKNKELCNNCIVDLRTKGKWNSSAGYLYYELMKVYGENWFKVEEIKGDIENNFDMYIEQIFSHTSEIPEWGEAEQ